MSDEHDGERAPAPLLRDAAVTPASKTIAEILERLPGQPGVYLMKDKRGKVIYVGKAASLKNRVRQYFQKSSGDTRDFVPLLESIVGDIETVVTGTEKEALLLENTLIKRHQPRFNVKLSDDKNFLVLRLDPAAEWPRLEVVRRIHNDGAFYFGPYHSATSCREALRVVNRHFQLRTCTDHVLHNRRRPCLQYQIQRCPAPCVYDVPAADYADQVRDVRLFLEGKSDELLDRLRARMKDAAAHTAFERAAHVRDQLRALEATLEAQRVVAAAFVDQDVIGFFRDGLALEIVVLTVRQGKLIGSKAFSFGGQEFPDAELLSSFVGLYYDLSVTPPDELLLPFAIEDAALKAEWLSEKRPSARKVEILVPQRGPRRALLELAQKNAAAAYATRRDKREDAELMLAKLGRRLKLAHPPRVIECYDISHIQGFATVASMVVFVGGRPDKARYRTFNVKAPQRTGGADAPDDFASMYEVLSRRFRRAREGDDGWELPDLVVVDGGKGQLGMALAAARDVGIDVRAGTGLPIIALAKERDLQPGDVDSGDVGETATVAVGGGGVAGEPDAVAPAPAVEAVAGSAERGAKTGASAGERGAKAPDRVFLAHAKDAIPIRPNSAEMFVLQHLRDEAHRFAIGFHRAQRRRRTLRSALGDVAGIGKMRQRQLLRHFGSLRKIREASVDDLAAAPGMTRAAAHAVHAFFAARPEEAPVPLPGASGSVPASPAPEAAAEEDAVDSAFAAVAAEPEGEVTDDEAAADEATAEPASAGDVTGPPPGDDEGSEG